jgi:hypothetical protein
MKKGLLPEKYYLLGFLLASYCASVFVWLFKRFASGSMSTYSENIGFWNYYTAISMILAVFVVVYNGFVVRHKGEKAVSFALALFLLMGSFMQFFRDRIIYHHFEILLLCIAIACCLAYMFMIVEKKIRKVKEK